MAKKERIPKASKGFKGYKFWKALTSFILFSIVVFAVSVSLVYSKRWIGFAFVGLGLLGLLVLKLSKIESKAIIPDLIFGAIDNGVLVFAAMWGANVAGVPGAIIGGAAGNTITDGIGGLFEGHIAEHQRQYQIDNLRTAMSTSFGKSVGCLLGAGIGLIFVWVISLF